MPRIDASRLAGGKRKVKSFAYTCSRNTLAAINTIFIVSYLKLLFLCVDFFFQRFPWIHFFCNARTPDLFRPFCTPLIFVWKVNKAVFACVCLDKGSFLDFSQLLSYRIFWNCSMILLSMVQDYPESFISNKT